VPSGHPLPTAFNPVVQLIGFDPGMSPDPGDLTLRHTRSAVDLDLLEPLWGALQAHHADINPTLEGGAPKRDVAESWRRRRSKYERWLQEPETFIVLAEQNRRPVGYAFVTIGPGLASWASGDRVAELETLSVLPDSRSAGTGTALLAAVWDHLNELGIEDMTITTAATNLGARRFYERHGFAADFVIYYGQRAR
jgi:ribosomal protein S18 acetylase RimI-like enzyme